MLALLCIIDSHYNLNLDLCFLSFLIVISLVIRILFFLMFQISKLHSAMSAVEAEKIPKIRNQELHSHLRLCSSLRTR